MKKRDVKRVLDVLTEFVVDMEFSYSRSGAADEAAPEYLYTEKNIVEWLRYARDDDYFMESLTEDKA